MSDYIPPPPPYEFSLQHDRKVTESEIQTLQICPFGHAKHTRSLADKLLGDVHNHPTQPKCVVAAGSNGAGLRTPRPLPPSPASTPSPASGSTFAEVKKHTAYLDNAKDPHAPVHPHPSSSTYLLPSHHTPQIPGDPPCPDCDNRWPAETSFRRPSHRSSHSLSCSPSQTKSAGSHLSFDPSVAYADSKAWSSFQAPRGATSLYSHAVSSHLYPDSVLNSASRRPHVPARLSSPRQDQADMRSIRSQPNPVSKHPLPHSSSTSLHSRTRSSVGYEKGWASSAEDIQKKKHAGG